MPSLIDIRRRISSTKNTQQITKAMKMVSASRLRRAQERATSARPYADALANVHRSVLSRLPELSGELYQEREGKTLLIVLSGDKGLCGAFNANIFKLVKTVVDREGAENVVYLPVGKKAAGFARQHGWNTVASYADVFRDVSFALAEEISGAGLKMFQGEEIAKVVVLFNQFKNVLIQEPTEWTILPLERETSEDDEPAGVEHLAEPDLKSILGELSPKVVMNRVYQALLESCAAEHAARMTAMDAATNNAKDLIEQLTLDMNKARQAAITTELIEVVSGAAAL